MSALEFTTDELFAVLLARDLRSEDRVVQVGANMPVARAAVILANMTRLPDMRICIGLGCENLAGGRTPPPVYPFLFDQRGTEGSESLMHQQFVFDDISKPDVFFFGGLQLDRRGNINLLGLTKPEGGWKLRGPGAIALPSMTTTCRGYYIVMPRHDARSFVEKVDLITALGDRTKRAELGIEGGGARLVLSPLGVFDFDDAGDMRIRSLHAGVTVEQAQEATGFPLVVPAAVPDTTPPTAEELKVLRTRVDLEGVLRGGR